MSSPSPVRSRSPQRRRNQQREYRDPDLADSSSYRKESSKPPSRASSKPRSPARATPPPDDQPQPQIKHRPRFEQVPHPRPMSRREERISRILQDPSVQRQMRQLERRRFRPWFIWTVSVVQVLMLLVSLGVNYNLTGSVIETQPLNIMIGPGAFVPHSFFNVHDGDDD